MGMDKVIEVLGSVKDKFKASLSWSDLIVLAGIYEHHPVTFTFLFLQERMPFLTTADSVFLRY